MPMTTIIFGIALIAQGFAGYFATGQASKTALIPTIPGGILALLGALAHRPGSRAAAMHAAVAVAALGIAGALLGGRRAPSPNRVAKAARATMAATCSTYVALGVRAYVAGRCAAARG